MDSNGKGLIQSIMRALGINGSNRSNTRRSGVMPVRSKIRCNSSLPQPPPIHSPQSIDKVDVDWFAQPLTHYNIGWDSRWHIDLQINSSASILRVNRQPTPLHKSLAMKRFQLTFVSLLLSVVSTNGLSQTVLRQPLQRIQHRALQNLIPRSMSTKRLPIMLLGMM